MVLVGIRGGKLSEVAEHEGCVVAQHGLTCDWLDLGFAFQDAEDVLRCVTVTFCG